jgi:metal-responsive CopG/Arc/MetJ family transcriptional regulator
MGLLIVEFVVEYLPHMESIQIVLDTELRIAADDAARSRHLNRSQLMREALREYLQRLEGRAREERDRAGYAKNPTVRDESQDWESEAVWPEQ